MASFLLPSSIQKRLLRYALSRLEILDTDALDLEHLDIAWGTKSVLEFRNVGLRLKKLSSLLQLPSNFVISRARVLVLRITIPVDIYSSPIAIVVDGVEGHLRISQADTAKSRSKPTSDKAPSSRASGGNSRLPGAPNYIPGEDDPTLPTAADLAQSFLQTEPAGERAELEAAISSSSQYLGESSLASSDDEADEDAALGTGAGLTLPVFMTNFLQGIVDRLQIQVRGIQFNLAVDVSNDSPLGLEHGSTIDPVTVQLKVADIDVEGVTPIPDVSSGGSAVPGKDSKQSKPVLKEGKRLVRFREIQVALISEANLFANLARSTAASSPRTTRSTRSDMSELRKDYRATRSDMGSSRLSESTTSNFTARHEFDLESQRLSESNDRLLGMSNNFDGTIEQGSPDGDFLDTASRTSGLYSPISRHSSTAGSEIFPMQDSFETPRVPLDDNFDPFGNDGPSNLRPVHSTTLPIRELSTSPRDRVSHSQPLPVARPNSSNIPSTPRRLSQSSCGSATSTEFADAESIARSISPDQALAQSMIFSHNEAQSMYMSAMSEEAQPSRMPGAWDTSSVGSGPSSPGSPPRNADNLENALHPPISTITEASETTSNQASTIPQFQHRNTSSGLDPKQHYAQPVRGTSDLSDHSSIPSEEVSRISKRVLSLDEVSIYLASASAVPLTQEEHLQSSNIFESTFDGTSQSIYADIPGTFSAHASQRFPKGRRPEGRRSEVPPKPEIPKRSDTAVDVVLGLLDLNFDVSVARLLVKVVQFVIGSLDDQSPATSSKSSTDSEPPAQNMKMSLRSECISIRFLDHLPGFADRFAESAQGQYGSIPVGSEVLLRTALDGLDVTFERSELLTKTKITLEKFMFGYASENIVSFDAGLRMGESTRDLSSANGKDLSVEIKQTKDITRYSILTLPLHVSIDLQRLDETFSWFGGLSGVLNMGSSMASNATATAVIPPKPAGKPRGVRFDAPIKVDDQSLSSQNKADIRIGGFVLDLLGKDCSIGVETTAVKVVSREEGIGVGIDMIKLSGPHLRGTPSDPAIEAEILTTRIEFLPAPKDTDLDRLLALITPSKSKYDQDDDILLDTLLRQRRKGSVLRVTIDNLRIQLIKLDELNYLPQLGEELSRLSTVTKYLPEDDRPGLLSLVLIRKLDLDVNVKESIGSLQLSTCDLEIAQITLPALIALSINSIKLTRNNSEDLISTATDIELRELSQRSPAIMARLIGDEMEPVVKIKLWNVQVDYRVPTIMAVLGIPGEATMEELSAGLAESIITLKDQALMQATHLMDSPTPQTPRKSSEAKPMSVDIVVRDCILGLNPLGLPSKLLVVLTEARLGAVLPKDQNVTVGVELNRASVLLIDDLATLVKSDRFARPRRGSFDGGSHQVADLSAMGYVSVSTISSTKIDVKVLVSKDSEEKRMDMELRDSFLVLETCADSTATLMAVLNALSPPRPASTELKYRTKVDPVPDMMASIYRDAFGTAEGNYGFDDFGSALGDSETNSSDNLDLDEEYFAKEFDGADAGDLLFDAGEGSSLDDSRITVQDTKDGLLLESSIHQQDSGPPGELLVDEEYFGTRTSLHKFAKTWNSTTRTYERVENEKVKQSPLQLRVRDVHVIWNLFDGYDWQYTRDKITKTVQDVQSKAIEKRARRPAFDQDIEDNDTVIGDFLFNSIYIGVPANRDPRELTMAINQELNDGTSETESTALTAISATTSRQGVPSQKGKKLKLKRSRYHKITFELKGVNVDFIAFPPESGETESSIDIRVRDLDVFDHVPTSTWKKFATYMHDAGEREKGASMAHLEVVNVRPVADLAATEIVLKVSVLPLRLHVDQDALDFITRFFEFKDDSAPPSAPSGNVPFVQRVEIMPIPVKLDLKPKRVDYAALRSGRTSEMMNFIVLDGADMVLRHTIMYGVSGFDRLGKSLNDVWTRDITTQQLPGILAGLAPARSLVNISSGVRDLFVVPIREYKKDGRIVRSLTKGGAAFAKTTGTELIRLGAKLAIGTQTVLTNTEQFLSRSSETRDVSTGWEDIDDDDEERKQISLYADQPIGVAQGLRGAYKSLARDLMVAKDAIIAVPAEVMESGSAQGAAMAVLGRAPTIVIRPAIGATKAIGQTLMGAGNTLDPQNRRRVRDKYKEY